MHDQAMHLLKTLGKRNWLTRSLAVYSLSPLTRSPFCNVHISYSAMKETVKLFSQTSASSSSNQLKQTTPELSLLAKKMLGFEQSGEMSEKADECIEDTTFSTDKLRKRLETLEVDVYGTLGESKEDIALIQNVKIDFVPQVDQEQDNSVESIVFLSDLEKIRTVKPSPLLGTEDATVPPSKVPCVGCGAPLQCQHKTFPGFLPSEHFKLLSANELRTSLCQRCYYIRHCNAFVEVSVQPEDFAQMISKIKPTRSVVVMVVDVMDIYGSIVPDLATYIGHKHPVVIVGNKADLLAPDGPDYLKNVKQELEQACYNVGLENIRKCIMISAKTGFGIDKLITYLFSLYKLRADVYIVGTANAGKSSLFNTLLASDYCKHTARDLIQRATISVWPGTTLNLLKFPIMRPTPYLAVQRHMRLQQEFAQKKEQKLLKSAKKEKELSWELKANVVMSDMRTELEKRDDDVGNPWGQKVYGFEITNQGAMECTLPEPTPFEAEKYDKSYWAHDTPGIINPNQIINLLTTEEIPYLTPASMIIPRCVYVAPGDTLFVSGLARIDYLQGTDLTILTVHCGPDIPIKIILTKEADQFYEQNVGTAALGIPLGNQDRLKKLPALAGKEFTIKGTSGQQTAAADIQLSSIGWVSVAPRNHQEVVMKAYTPGMKGLELRMPALLSSFKKYKGKRIKKTQYFYTLPAGSALANKHLNVRDGDQ